MRCYKCLNSEYVRIDKDYKCKRMPLCEIEDKDRIKYIKSLNIKPGSKIKLDDNKWWLIQAIDDRFIICTNKDYYTVLDIEDGIRGPDNHYGYYDYSELNAMEYEIALAQFHIKEPTSIHDLNVKPQTKDWYIENRGLSSDNEALLNPEEKKLFDDWDILEPLEISYRNFVNFKILEVK